MNLSLYGVILLGYDKDKSKLFSKKVFRNIQLINGISISDDVQVGDSVAVEYIHTSPLPCM